MDNICRIIKIANSNTINCNNIINRTRFDYEFFEPCVSSLSYSPNIWRKQKQPQNMITISVPAFKSKFQVFEISSFLLKILRI